MFIIWDFFAAWCSISLDPLTPWAPQSQLSGKWTNANLKMNCCQEVLSHQDCVNCNIFHSVAEWLKTHYHWTHTSLFWMIIQMDFEWIYKLLFFFCWYLQKEVTSRINFHKLSGIMNTPMDNEWMGQIKKGRITWTAGGSVICSRALLVVISDTEHLCLSRAFLNAW